MSPTANTTPTLSQTPSVMLPALSDAVDPSTNRSGQKPPFPVTSGLLTELDAALALRLSVKTLRTWRQKRRGPRFHRLGRAVRYRPSDIAQFIASSAVSPESTGR